MIPGEQFQAMTIKGNRDGLLITLAEGEWTILRNALIEQIGNQESFFRGARITLDVGRQVVHAAEMGRLRDDLSGMGVILSTVLSNAPQTTYTARMLGLAISQHNSEIKSSYNPAHGAPALIIREKLMAGMKIESDHDLIVWGNVVPGVQLESRGSIIVWGRLQGSVHAGIGSHEDAVVCALVMAPTQMRIAGMLYQHKIRVGIRKPETARITNGEVIIEPWSKYKND